MQLLCILICSNHCFGRIIQCDLPSQGTSELIWCPFLLTKLLLCSPLRGMHTHINVTMMLCFVQTGPSMHPSELMAEMRNSGFALKKCVLGRNATVCDPAQVISRSPPTPSGSNKTNDIHAQFRARRRESVIAAKRPIIRQRHSDSSHSKFSQESRLDETNYRNYRKAGEQEHCSFYSL